MIFAILIDWILAQSSSERLHPATNGSRCRDPQSNIRCSPGNLAEQEEEAQRGTGYDEDMAH